MVLRLFIGFSEQDFIKLSSIFSTEITSLVREKLARFFSYVITALRLLWMLSSLLQYCARRKFWAFDLTVLTAELTEVHRTVFGSVAAVSAALSSSCLNYDLFTENKVILTPWSGSVFWIQIRIRIQQLNEYGSYLLDYPPGLISLAGTPPPSHTGR